MSTDSIGPSTRLPALADAGPLGTLPRLDGSQVRLESRLRRPPGPDFLLGAVFEPIRASATFGPPEILWRASGLNRAGAIARLSWHGRKTRIGLGIETSVAHGIVDRLLGFDRFEGEPHLQISPVEFGILLFAVEETLGRLAASSGPIGPWDLDLDRIGPDPFDPEGLGALVTIRWPVAIGRSRGSIRLWLPSSSIEAWLATPTIPGAPDPQLNGRARGLSGVWVASAGFATLARGLARLKVGSILPIDGAPLRGTVASPVGPIALTTRAGPSMLSFNARAKPNGAGGRLVLDSPLRRTPSPREPISVDPSSDPGSVVGPNPGPANIPVTLAVELGRVNLTLDRLADLKPGDVIELGRHAREPVELTSGGRLVARGELIQIDTELGVRVLSVFL